jgi:beta-amylase
MSVRAAMLATLGSATEVFVMLPLDTVTQSGLKDKDGLGGKLDQLKSANVDGIMADVWWGLTEPSPKAYDFDAYAELIDMAKIRGMKVQVVSSFHQCGGNVGDTCNIPLPSFVTSASGIWYKDHAGNEDKEYVSLFADDVSIGGRTPVQMYRDWFDAFAGKFSGDLGSTITEIQVGMGPAGELRYPSYQLSHWSFCGVGAFQCFDDHALASFKQAAGQAGHSEWDAPPGDAGDYNSRPDDVSFFQSGYSSNFGEFFLGWYFDMLKNHGHSVLGAAKAAFGSKVGLAGKIAGIHWWYNSPSHAAELTAGYYNVNGKDAYGELGAVFKKHGAALDFTCLEMRDSEQDSSCASGPEELVRQVASAASGNGLAFNGENALVRYDDTAYEKILSYGNQLQSFTYLRLSDDLLNGGNFDTFKGFVSSMHNAGISV